MRNLFLLRKYERHSYKCGEVFGRLTLTGLSCLKPMYGQQRRIVEAVCICGEVKWYLFEHLIKGDTKSCGCLRRDTTRKRMTTHGLTKHPLYDVYRSMINRCYLENDAAYKNYGGRGISVCEEWREDFLAFYEWAMANGYEEGKSIDRKNNDGNYYPGNCHFTDRGEQSRNNRRNKMITAFGETKCLFDWGKDKRCKVGVWGLRNRFDRGNWSSMEAMISSPPVDKKTIKTKANRNLTAFGETKCFAAWLRDKRCLVKIDSLRDRLAKGWSAEKAMSTLPIKILTAWGATKTQREWSKDERCVVGVDCLRDRIYRGWNPEQAISIPSKVNKQVIFPAL